MSSQVAGLGSSRWNPPSNDAPLRQVEKVANSYAPTITSNVRPRLHIQEPNAQKGQEQHVQTPDEQPEFIPPHLRGVITPLKTSPSLNGPTPPNLRPKPVSVNISREHKPQAKNPDFMNDGFQNQTQQSPTHTIQTPAMPPANLQGTAIPLIAQPPSGTKPDRGDFLSFLNKKLSAAAEAKKKETAEKVHVATQPVTPLSTPNGGQSSTLPLSRNKFRPNTETDQAFQLFLRNQIQGPVTNGKKYKFTGSQQSPQTLAVASTQSLNAGLSLQVQNPNRNASKTPFDTVDPHSAFGPGHMAAKSGASLMFDNDEAAVDALVEPGFEPANTSEGFEDKISDSGVGVKVKENVRASQGQDPKNEFLDWDGKTWRPAPVDWETDRTAFDNGFMATYIRQDWEPSVPRGTKVEVNTQDPKFKLAVWVGEKGFETPIDHPMTIPDLANSENEENQRHQTADTSSKPVAKKEEKRVKATQSKAQTQEKHNRELELRLEEEHPYKPKIEVYLRPATENDSKGIADIYNYYTQNLLTTEDQGFITTEDVEALIKHSKDENLPIIVAVRGKMPLSSPGKPHQPKKVSLPQFESIIGFGYAETYCYGLGGSRNGRSRFTKSLCFFVHPDHTRLKVGQSLLDRLIQTLSRGYGAKNGYEWMDPNNDPVYQHGGVHKVHQLVIQYAIEQKHDPNYQWMKDFLRRYFFDEEGRIHSLARSQASGPGAKFADVVFFCKELAANNEFGAMI